ncbi:MAG TPA: alpha-L-rhamnosidase C-terminal domain-containing protein [Fimbriimonadaceae bacterium]|nr:alpha-L-rhamnosidase C-terminal domain-containing protein [Fimbriimonadaceae bacterium]
MLLVVLAALMTLGRIACFTPPEPDRRGPIQYAGLKVEASPGLVQAVNYQFTDDCAKPGPWHAKWIALPDSQQKPTAVLFRREFRLDATPTHARFWVSADIGYRLYVNGRLTARGPADIGRDYDREERGPRWLYDCRDLSGRLHAGVNVISAEVFTENFYIAKATRKTPALVLEGKLEFPGGSSQTIKTDDTWTGAPNEGWHGGQIDLSKEPLGWRLPGFAQTWPRCVVTADVWTPLAPSEIPPQMEVRYPVESAKVDEQPVAVMKGALPPIRIERDGHLVLTYDRVMAAYPSFKIDGVKGVKLKIAPGEQAGHESRTVYLTLRDGLQTFEYPYMDSFSVLRLDFTGIPTGRAVELLDVGANFTSMPVKYEGSFECSDPRLNDLWDSSRWLTQICMQDHHLDSPNHQEPICDPGDYLIESHANYYSFGVPWLARQDLRKFGLMLRDLNYRNFHTSYSLLWLQMLMLYYDYTGDAALVKELAPEVYGLLDTFTGWRGRNGLISEAPNYMFMDWVTIDGFECHHPPAVIGQGYMTAFYYRALEDGIRVARLTGDKAREQSFEALRSQVATAFNRELWDEDKGLYRDGKPNQSSVKPSQWLPADKEIETFSPHVNTLAVLYDLAPRARQPAIMDRVMATKPITCQPYFAYFVLEALRHCGRFDSATGHAEQGAAGSAHSPARELIDRWQIEPDTKTYHEMWTSGDLSHAWGSAPLIQMSTTVLGVRPLSPGFARFSIRPTPFGLDWAKGVVPTPHGPITVNWMVKSGRFSLEAQVPAHCVAEVELPGSAQAVTWRSGKHSLTAG